MKKLRINLVDVLYALTFMAIMMGAILFTAHKLADIRPAELPPASCDTYSNYPLGYIPSRCIKQYLPGAEIQIAAPKESGL